MSIVAGLIGFIAGVITTHIADKEHIRSLNQRIEEMRIQSEDKLKNAYQEIGTLKKQIKILRKIRNYDNKN